MSAGEWIWLRVTASPNEDGSIQVSIDGEEADQEFLVDFEFRRAGKSSYTRIGVKR